MRLTTKRLWLGGLLACGLVGTGCETTSRRRNPERKPVPFPANLPHSGLAHAGTGSDPRSTVLQAQAVVSADPSSGGNSQPNVDLAYALELARVGNPTVNLAREAVREAEAGVLAANALKLPSLNAGFNFNLHRGGLQRPQGTIDEINKQGLDVGFGTGAVGGGTTVIPGVRLFYPLADVISAPRISGQQLATRRSDAIAVEYVTLLDVATAYIELHLASVVLEELKRSEAEFAEIVRLTAEFAKAGQGRAADTNRAAANAEMVRRQSEDAFGSRAAAAARLAAVLSLDPATQLILPPGPLAPLQLIDANATTESLVARAEAYRPEVAARASEVMEARWRERREEIRPWLPTLAAGYSIGGFGGGGTLTPPEFGRFGARSDFDVAAVWSVQNLGVGNRTRVNRNRAVVSQSMAAFDATRNRVREEVLNSHAQIVAAGSQIETARRRLVVAEDGYRAERKRIQQGEGLPLELLDSTRSLLETRLELARAIAAYNVAQFQLLAAVGTSPASAPLPAK